MTPALRLCLILVLFLGPSASADPVSLARLARHGTVIDASFVDAAPPPARWDELIAAAPIRAGAWRAWVEDRDAAERITHTVGPSTRLRPSVRSGASRPGLAAVYLDVALHGHGPVEDRAELARFGASLAEDPRLLQVAMQTRKPGLRAALAAGVHPRPAALAEPVLRQALLDEERVVRQAAISTIGRRSDAGLYTEALIQAAGDRDPVVRMLAVRALGWHGLTAGLGVVRRAGMDPEGEVRVAAWTSLLRLDPDLARAEAQRVGPDEDPWVDRQVQRLLARPRP